MGIALDTNIFILAYNHRGIQGEIARKLLDKLTRPGSKIFISVLVLEEFLVKIYKKGLEKNLADYENFLTGGGLYTAVDVNRQIARVAAKIRADYPSIRTPDAIHIASAIESGAKEFITTDRRIPKKIGALKVVVLQANKLN